MRSESGEGLTSLDIIELLRKHSSINTKTGTRYIDNAVFEVVAIDVFALINQVFKKEMKYKIKADKWDALDEKIGKFYPDDEADEAGGDLCDIGEAAAMAFGYL